MLMNDFHFMIGIVSVVLSALIFCLNMVLVYLFLTVPTFRKYWCYNILAQLGISQCLQLLGHFITGIFTILGVFPELAQEIIGGAINGLWMTMVALVLTLAINRLLMASFIFPKIYKGVRSALFVFISYLSWLLGSGLFTIYMTPYTRIIYDFGAFFWMFDSLGPWSAIMMRVYDELGYTLLLITSLIYLILGIMMVYKKYISKEKNPQTTSPEIQRKHLEKQIFIHSAINFLLLGIFIVAYQNNVRYLAQFEWFEFSVNLIWILYLVVNPLLCIIIIRPVRNELVKLFYSKDVKDLQVYYMPDQRWAQFLTRIKHRSGSIIPDSSSSIH